MADYFVRVFCTQGDVPPAHDLLDWLEAREIRLRLKDSEQQKAKWRDWDRLDLIYSPSKAPLPAICFRGEAATRETERFIKAVGPAKSSKVKKRVLDILKNTKFVVAFQHPPDMDEAGYDASGQLLTYFDENNAALIQADKEGFYERSICILKIPDLK